MKKTLSIVCLFIISCTMLWARPVDSRTAILAAKSFLSTHRCTDITLVDISEQTPFGEFYTFVWDNGFILIAGDDCVKPVLGYSTTSNFKVDGMPEHVADWLRVYDEQIAYYKKLCSDEPNTEWKRLLTGKGPEEPYNTSVSPLLTTTWSQNPYYNNFCPYDSLNSAQSVAGCTATATAQIMKYWNHPTTGHGSHTYKPDDCAQQSANFGNTTYAWSSMPDILTSSSTTTQVNAVATLIFHVGVAVEMKYHSTSSSAATSGGSITNISAENALKKYFKYMPTLYTVTLEDYSTTEFCNILKNELDNSRPILYSGRDVSSGHAFVLDGYDNSGQFHINWGWNGNWDGYFAIGNLNTGGGGTGSSYTHSYNLSNKAVIGITPNNNFGGTTTVQVSSNNNSWGTAVGNGSYSLDDTVVVKANAQSGYRFSHWNDGDMINNRTFLATGGSMTFNAIFESLGDDTISYCGNKSFQSSLGYASGGTKHWGIKLPASVINADHNLTKVQFYANYEGSYTITILTGFSSPNTTLASTTVTVTSSEVESWITALLPTPLALDGTKPVWIKFTNSDINYPAAYTYGSGNGDGILWGDNLNSLNNRDASWMIRAIFEDPNMHPSVHISGPTDVIVSTPATFTASGTTAGSFTWNLQSATPSTATGNSVTATWETPGQYKVVCTATGGGGIAHDTLTVNVHDQFLMFLGCEGNGNGSVDTAFIDLDNLCGQGFTVNEGDVRTVYVEPDMGSYLEHFYFNNTDIMNDLNYPIPGYDMASYTFTVSGNVNIRAVFKQNVSIDETYGEKVLLYPNPTSDKVTIEVGEPATIIITDMTGRTVTKKATESGTVEIERLENGTYLVLITTSTTNIVKKLIVNK